LWDAFESIVLPRRVARRFRLARAYYIITWGTWRVIARWMRPGKFREIYLSVFGPLSILLLLITWAIGLVLGFAFIHAGVGGSVIATGEPISFLLDLYLSGTTFFTLGLGDVIPRTMTGRVVTVAEAGIGFGFLAMVIGYLPILYQAFSRREITISLMDARCGSPPSASELLRRFGRPENHELLRQLMVEWERWSAEVLESHLSYPMLVYYRSQHDNQSWLGALTMILDTCSLIMVTFEKEKTLQTRLTFAMARHTATDIAQTLKANPVAPQPDRLPATDLEKLRNILSPAGDRIAACIACGTEGETRLAELRALYEPYVNGLSERLLLPLPPWIPENGPHYNWRTTAWQRSAEGIDATAAVDERDDHR